MVEYCTIKINDGRSFPLVYRSSLFAHTNFRKLSFFFQRHISSKVISNVNYYEKKLKLSLYILEILDT